MKTLLITAIGGDISQGVAQIVREVLPDCRIVGTDVHTEHAGALYADEFILSPRASVPEYRAHIEKIIEDHKVDGIWPLSEAEIAYWQPEINRGAAPVVHWITAGQGVIEVAMDKLKTAEFISGIGLPAPWTVAAELQNEPIEYPCIFKPRRGAGSKTVFICRDSADAAYLSRRYPGSIYQQLLEPADSEITCGVHRDRKETVRVVQLRRRLMGGFTGWCEVILDPQVQQQCEILAARLDLNGSMNVQLRLTDQGPRIFEINPRVSSTVMIRHLFGYQDVVWTLNDLTGAETQKWTPPVGAQAVRLMGAKILNNDPHNI